MYRLSISSGCFRHSLCRTTCRCRQKYLHSFQFEEFNYRSNRCCLTCTGATRKYAYSVSYSRLHRITLKSIKLNALALLYYVNCFIQPLFTYCKCVIKTKYHSRNAKLHIIVSTKIHIFILDNNLLFYCKIHKIIIKRINCNL